MAFPILKRTFAESRKAGKYRNREYRNRIKMKGLKPVITNMKRKIRKLK